MVFYRVFTVTVNKARTRTKRRDDDSQLTVSLSQLWSLNNDGLCYSNTKLFKIWRKTKTLFSITYIFFLITERLLLSFSPRRRFRRVWWENKRTNSGIITITKDGVFITTDTHTHTHTTLQKIIIRIMHHDACLSKVRRPPFSQKRNTKEAKWWGSIWDLSKSYIHLHGMFLRGKKRHHHNKIIDFPLKSKRK